jgi:hypothetical protein
MALPAMDAAKDDPGWHVLPDGVCRFRPKVRLSPGEPDAGTEEAFRRHSSGVAARRPSRDRLDADAAL